MVYYKEVEAKNGKTVKNYYMTQGDTFQNELAIKNSTGGVVSKDLIQEVLFKLSDLDYNVEYSKEYTYSDELSKWVIDISSEDTTQWAIDTHYYEYQITYTDGTVSTPVQAKFTVLNQIQGE